MLLIPVNNFQSCQEDFQYLAVDKVSCLRNRVFYMSAHVLLNSLNQLRKRDKMEGLQSILSHFCNKFNNSGARIFRFYLSHDIKLLNNCILARICQNFAVFYAML